MPDNRPPNEKVSDWLENLIMGARKDFQTFLNPEEGVRREAERIRAQQYENVHGVPYRPSTPHQLSPGPPQENAIGMGPAEWFDPSPAGEMMALGKLIGGPKNFWNKLLQIRPLGKKPARVTSIANHPNHPQSLGQILDRMSEAKKQQALELYQELSGQGMSKPEIFKQLAERKLLGHLQDPGRPNIKMPINERYDQILSMNVADTGYDIDNLTAALHPDAMRYGIDETVNVVKERGGLTEAEAKMLKQNLEDLQATSSWDDLPTTADPEGKLTRDQAVDYATGLLRGVAKSEKLPENASLDLWMDLRYGQGDRNPESLAKRIYEGYKRDKVDDEDLIFDVTEAIQDIEIRIENGESDLDTQLNLYRQIYDEILKYIGD